MVERNRQYSIRLRNGEQEIEIHHDPELISNIFSQFLPGLRDSFSKAHNQTSRTLLTSGADDIAVSLPGGSLNKSEEPAPDVVEPAIATPPLRKTITKRRSVGGRISKPEKEEMTKVIEGHFEGERAYQDAINRTEDAETRALLVLDMAQRYFNIRGFSAGQVATILREKFKQPVPRQTIQTALNKGKLAVKEGSKYVIMQPGINKVKQVLETKDHETREE